MARIETIKGEHYITRATSKQTGGSFIKKRTNTRNWWLVKHNTRRGATGGYLTIKKIFFPPSFIGKKIRLKVEIIKDAETKIKKCLGCELYFETGTRENHCPTCLNKKSIK